MRRIIPICLVLFFTLAAGAQQPATAFCALNQTLDFKTAKAGDKIGLHLTRDLVVAGKKALSRGTAVSATILDAKNGNTVSIVLDKATLKPGQDVPLMGIIAAVAAPPEDLTEDPFYSMNRSTEATQRTGNASVTSVASSGAAVQTAILEGENNRKSNLRENSSGAIGIDGVKLTWVLDKPPATTVLTAKKKNFKLQKGTEVLIRMAPPQI
jgi:selenocysteine-specific translation elongation factor